MDGNGRWAKARRLPRVAGHRQGVEAVRRITRAAREQGIEALTLYAFSSENWRRPEEEIGDLMGLLRHFLKNEIKELTREGVRLRILGNYRALKADLVELIDDAVARTAANTGPILAIALNYVRRPNWSRRRGGWRRRSRRACRYRLSTKRRSTANSTPMASHRST